MMATRIPRHPEAFSKDPSVDRKRPRERSSAHLAFVRTLPCVVCLTHRDVEAAHIRMPSPAHGKRSTGIGRKPDDLWTLPMCRVHHEEQHSAGNETAYWACQAIDPFVTAMAIHACTGDEHRANVIIRESRRVLVKNKVSLA